VITVVAVVVLLTAAWLAVNRRANVASVPVGPMRTTPLTTLPRLERSPSFSPDGNQIAFSWDGDSGNEVIYVKLVGAGSPLRLTTSTAPDVHPAWSPKTRNAESAAQGPTRGGRRRAIARPLEPGGADFGPAELGFGADRA